MDPSEAESNHEVPGESCTDWADWFVTGEPSVWQRGIILLSQTADRACTCLIPPPFSSVLFVSVLGCVRDRHTVGPARR